MSRIKDARLALIRLEGDHLAITDYSNLISILAEGTEISAAAVPGIYRIATLIEQHAQAIHDGLEEAMGILREAEPQLTVVSG